MKQLAQLTQALLLLAPLPIVLSLVSVPGAVIDIEEVLERKLELRIESMTLRADGLSKEDAGALRRAVGDDSGVAQRILVYDLDIEGEASEDDAVRVGVLSFDGALEGGVLAVAIASDGSVVARSVWGADEFDEDPQSWALFLDQFDRQPSLNRVMDPRQAASEQELAGLLERMQGDESEEGVSVQALYEQRLIMRENSYRFSIVRTVMSGPEPIDWLRAWSASFSRLSAISGDIGMLLEDGAGEQYRAASEAGQSIVEAAIGHLESGDGRAAARALKPLYPVSCKACHEIREHGLGDKNLYWSTMEALPDLSVRDDFARVGTDVFALPDRKESCQVVATGLKACLLVLGTVE